MIRVAMMVNDMRKVRQNNLKILGTSTKKFESSTSFTVALLR